jgi:hypothetical protein
MQETFELVMINVIFKFCEQPANEVANEHHLGLQGARNGDEDGLQGAGKPRSNAKTRWLLERYLLPKFVRQAVASRLEIMLKVKHVVNKAKGIAGRTCGRTSRWYRNTECSRESVDP